MGRLNGDDRENGLKAVAVAPLVTEFVTACTAAIVDRLTSLYNSGRLTPEAALAGIGEIAALDGLLRSIGETARRGQRAEQKEMASVLGREDDSNG